MQAYLVRFRRSASEVQQAEDGVLLVQRKPQPYLWLKRAGNKGSGNGACDGGGENVRKGPASELVLDTVVSGNTIELAGYSIEVIGTVGGKDQQQESCNHTASQLQTSDPSIPHTSSRTVLVPLSDNSSSSHRALKTTPSNQRALSAMWEEETLALSGTRRVLDDGCDIDGEALTKRQSLVRCGKVDAKDIEIESSLLAVLRPHQLEAVQFLLSRMSAGVEDMREGDPTTGAILADDVGTGKTLVGLTTLHSLTRHYHCKALIVCPSSLVLTWRAELLKWIKTPLRHSALFVETKDCDASVLKFVHSSPESRPLLVISYELFRPFAQAINSIRSLRVVLCDEGHRIKNAAGTKTSIALGNCIATKRIVLTGTPVQNNLDELFAVVNFVCPQFLGSLAEFRATYCSDAGKDLLKTQLTRIMLRRSRETVLRSSLPPRKEFIIRCAMSEPQSTAYLTAFDQRSADNQLATLTKLRLLSTLPPSSENESSKLGLLMRLLDGALLSKTVVVSSFTVVLDAVATLLRQRNRSSFRIDGGIPLERRQRIVSAFNSAENVISVLLLSAKAGGVGLTLTGADRIVLLEPDWNPAVDAQCMGRVWRQGQTRPVFVYRLLALGTVEESILRRQGVKAELCDLIGDGDGVAEEDATEEDAGEDIAQDMELLALPRGRAGVSVMQDGLVGSESFTSDSDPLLAKATADCSGVYVDDVSDSKL